MKSTLAIILLITIGGCTLEDQYDVLRYHSPASRDSVLTRIVNHIFEAPPYTLMKDRFAPEHFRFYKQVSSKFSVEKYFVAPDGTHYFYVLRPGPKIGEKRGVGGHFKYSTSHDLQDFREVFVTQIMSEKDIKEKCAFLFNEMVKGNIDKYLGMELYVQWPNKISYYDSTTYEWKMKPEFVY